MTVHAIATDTSLGHLLPGAQFADTFRIATGNAGLTARQAAERMFLDPPPWIDRLMRLRDAIVAPLGLKTPSHRKAIAANSIGPFPVIAERRSALSPALATGISTSASLWRCQAPRPTGR